MSRAGRHSAGWGAALAVVAALAFGAAVAQAAPAGAGAASAGHVVDRSKDGVVIDWTRGMIIAPAAAAADLRARSPEVARVEAKRDAVRRAREELTRRAGDIRLADGRRARAALARRRAREVLRRAVKHSLDLDVDYGSDGSVVLREGLPLEAVRAAVWRAKAPPPGAAHAPITGVVVDAGEVLRAPRLGLALSAGAVRYRGPVVYRYQGDRDPRLGAHPLRARAARLSRGALVLVGAGGKPFPPHRLAAAKNSGAVVVIQVKKAHP